MLECEDEVDVDVEVGEVSQQAEHVFVASSVLQRQGETSETNLIAVQHCSSPTFTFNYAA